MYESKDFIHTTKNQAPIYMEMLGSCEKSKLSVKLVTIPSRQLNCSTVQNLLQEVIAKGGDIHVDF